MNDQDIITRVRSAEGEDALGALTDEITQETLAPARAVVHAWVAGKPAEADKAGTVVLELNEVAVTPMLEEMDGSGVNWRWRLADEIVDLLVQQRRELLVRMDPLLTDRSASTASAAGPRDPSRRVCDDAYLLVRRVVSIDDPKRLGLKTVDEFVTLASADRDAEIKTWRRLEIWDDLLEGEAEETR